VSCRSKGTVCYLSPFEYPLLWQIPIFVNAGSVQFFRDETSLFIARGKGREGHKVECIETKDIMYNLQFVV
jgi:hypothetical protein